MYNKEQAAPLPDGSVPYGKFKTVFKNRKCSMKFLKNELTGQSNTW
jgi:hypothetical protein